MSKDENKDLTGMRDELAELRAQVDELVNVLSEIRVCMTAKHSWAAFDALDLIDKALAKYRQGEK